MALSWLRILGLTLTLVGLLRNAGASDKLSRDLSLRENGSTVDVIIQFNTEPTEQHHQKISAKGGTLKANLSGVIKGALYSVPASALEDISNDPAVSYITPDRPVRGMLDYANPTVNANIALQYGFDGTGVGVAVIDSGIITILDLMQTGGKTTRIVYNQS